MLCGGIPENATSIRYRQLHGLAETIPKGNASTYSAFQKRMTRPVDKKRAAATELPPHGSQTATSRPP